MLVDIAIPADVAEELADPRFLTMSHYSTQPASSGCKGPLCKLFMRDKMRKASARKAEAKGKIYSPNYKLRDQLAENRDEELYRIIIAHRIERKTFNFIKSDMRRTG